MILICPSSPRPVAGLPNAISSVVNVFGFLSVLLSLCLPAREAVAAMSPSSLAELSIEELINIQVTSVARQSTEFTDALASIYVITADDIDRSGATSLAEALRLAPNLQVARIDSVQYAITARGFNNPAANKLLVLMDGRTIYTPMYSGVFWDMQDIFMQDIDRIEVISGPGATLWGANAVNGVINIITKDTADTQGTLLYGDAGNRERGISARTGNRAGRLDYRVYGKYRDLDDTDRATGVSARDSWHRAQLGFRADWGTDEQTVTVQGDVYEGGSEHRGFVGDLEIPGTEVSGYNVVGRWQKSLNEIGNVQVQAYYDHTERDEYLRFRPRTGIFDIEFQHDFNWSRHDLVWGGGYMRADDTVVPSGITAYLPASRDMYWKNLFLQDDIAIRDNLNVILGIKLEWNDFTGREYLPTARVGWEVDSGHFLWAAYSRAVRAPSRLDRDVYFPATPPFLVAGGPDFQSEIANVVELGYRGTWSDRMNFSITAFHHDWDRLRSGTPPPLPARLANNIEGESYGLEGWANVQITDYWRLTAGFTTLRKDLRFEPGTSDTVGIQNPTLHNDPDYQLMIRSSINFNPRLRFESQLRRVDELPVEPVPSYTELNIRLIWRTGRNFEFSLSGENLLHDSHAEFGGLPNRSLIDRSIRVGVKWTP